MVLERSKLRSLIVATLAMVLGVFVFSSASSQAVPLPTNAYAPFQQMVLNPSGQSRYYYTTYSSELTLAKTGGWQADRFEGLLQRQSAVGTKPLHRLSINYLGATYWFYTANDSETVSAIATGWHQDADMGYIATTQLPGTVPLHRLVIIRNGQFAGYFYTVDQNQVNQFMASGWLLLPDAGYVWTPAESKIDVYGHSIAYGYGATNPAVGGYANSAASMLGVPVNNQAVSGSSIYTSGGYPKIFQDIHPIRNQGPYESTGLMAILHYGQNDLSQLGLNNLRPYQEGMRSAIARYQAGAVFEEDSSTVSYSGTWGNLGGCFGICSGTDMRYTGQVGSHVTITVPADFPGGAVTFGTTAVPNGGGAQWNFTVDGQVAGSLDSRDSAAPNNFVAYTKRFNNLSAGTHVIVATPVAIKNSFAAFDYWQIQDPTPPQVLLPTSLKAASYALYAQSAYPETDSGVIAINNLLRTTAAEFPNTQIVDIENVLSKNPANFSSDGLHPNNLGHSIIATTLVNQLYSSYPLQ